MKIQEKTRQRISLSRANLFEHDCLKEDRSIYYCVPRNIGALRMAPTMKKNVMTLPTRSRVARLISASGSRVRARGAELEPGPNLCMVDEKVFEYRLSGRSRRVSYTDGQGFPIELTKLSRCLVKRKVTGKPDTRLLEVVESDSVSDQQDCVMTPEYFERYLDPGPRKSNVESKSITKNRMSRVESAQ